MNKREVVWLIVKLIGTYFLYSAVVAFFGLIGAISALYSLPSDSSSASKTDTNVSAVSPIAAPDGFPMATPMKQPNAANKTVEKPLDPAMKKLRDEAIKNLLLSIFLTALYGAIGFYLIRDGRVLFWILNRESVVAAERKKEINSLGIYDDAN